MLVNGHPANPRAVHAGPPRRPGFYAPGMTAVEVGPTGAEVALAEIAACGALMDESELDGDDAREMRKIADDALARLRVS